MVGHAALGMAGPGRAPVEPGAQPRVGEQRALELGFWGDRVRHARQHGRWRAPRPLGYPQALALPAWPFASSSAKTSCSSGKGSSVSSSRPASRSSASRPTRQDLLRKTNAHKPDVVITDIQMPPDRTDDGLRAAIEIRRSRPETGVVVLSQFLEDRYALELVGERADGVGYLLKDRVGDPKLFVDSVRRVAARRLGAGPAGHPAHGRPPARLTARSTSSRRASAR